MLISEISYQQLQEMSEAGAKVLNSQAVQFAKEAKISLYARSTFSPGKETSVSNISEKELSGVRAVVYEKEVIRMFVNDQQKIKCALQFCEENQIPVKEFQLTSLGKDSKYKSSFITSASNVHDWEKLRESLEYQLGDDIYINEHFATLSVIGEGFSNNNLVLINTLNLLKENGIDVYGVGTTSFRISVLVERDILEQAVKVCHNYWIEEQQLV
jgi:aspartate kinase